MKILAVHGYQVFPIPTGPGIAARAVLRKVKKAHEEYAHIFFLGGWHCRRLGSRPTIAEIMRGNLISLGVGYEKLHDQFSLGLDNLIPPRDSVEEVDLLARLLREKFGTDPEKVEFDAIALWCCAPRLRVLYSIRRARCKRIISVNAASVPLRLPQELALYSLARFFDPWGSNVLLKAIRKRRTFKTQNGAKRCVAAAWAVG